MYHRYPTYTLLCLGGNCHDFAASFCYDYKVLSPVFLVDLVTEAHGVDDCELETHVALLELVGVGLELNAGLVVLSGLPFELGVEQGVHEGGLPKPGLPFKNTEEHKVFGHC